MQASARFYGLAIDQAAIVIPSQMAPDRIRASTSAGRRPGGRE